MGRKKHEKPNTNLTSIHSKILQLADTLILLSTADLSGSISKNIEQFKEINALIEQVQLLENEMDCSYSAKDRCSKDSIKKFTDWLNENGAKFDNIQIAEFPGYELGLKTDVDIDDSSLIITVPRDLMITLESARKSSFGLLIEKDPLLNNMPNVTLAMFLLLEKYKGNSFWKPYIDVLPSTYSTVLYFTIEDLMELQASATLEIALKQIRNVVRQYAYFYKLIWSLENPSCKLLRKHFTFNQYRWAVSTMMTRQNSVPSEDELQTINALIPLWDFCNHTNGRITTNYNAELKCCECFSVKDFKAGEQVLIFYGPRSNSELFIHNGFVYEDNENDRYWLCLGISKSDTLKEERLKILNRLSLPEHGGFRLSAGPQPIDGQLLAFLRIFNMDADQLREWQDKDNLDELENLKIVFDLEFEKKCWTFIVTRLQLILAKYKTNLEQDLDIIKENALSRNSILACKVRASEKRLLHSAIEFAHQRMNV